MPFTAAELDALGCTKAALRGWRERGEVVEICSGVYVAAHLHSADLHAIWSDRQVAAAAAVVPVAGAALHYELPKPPDLHGSLFQSRPLTAIPAEHRVAVGPLIMPSLAWTALRLALHQDLSGALISLDGALAKGVQREALRELAVTWSRQPGTRVLLRAIDCADARSGSALESWSRGLMIDAGIPTPVLQQPLHYRGFAMYPDFLWPQAHVIGEADGLEKYGDRFGKADAIGDEKRRQARLQEMGFVVVRWGWRDVRPDPRPWLAALREQLRRRTSAA